MSLIEKTDVKNHLSARHRTQIHLAPPPSRPDAAGLPREAPASADSKEAGSVHIPLLVPALNEKSPPVLSKAPQGTAE
jgi:hypothetical protein